MAFIVLSIPLIITLLLSNRSIQNYVVDKAATAAGDFLGTEVSIGNIEYQMPASIALNDVYLADLEADTLAYVGSLSARLSISALAHKRISIRNVEIDRAKFYLKTDTTGLTNLQFIIDVLQDTTQTEAPLLTFDAPGVKLKNSRVRIDNISMPKRTDNLFDAMHIDLSDINMVVSLNHAAQDSVNVEVDRFSFREKSGMRVSQMEFKTIMGNNRIALEDFKLRLIESEINIPVAEVLLDSLSQLASPSLLAANAKARFSIQRTHLSGKDFAAFIPEMNRLRHDLDIRTFMEYDRGNLDIRLIDLSYGTNTNLNMRAKILKLADALKIKDGYKNISIFAYVNNVGTDRADIENTVSDIQGKPFKLPKEMDGFTKINFRGSIIGKLPDAKYAGVITTNAGNIMTNARGGYNSAIDAITINGNVGLDNFDFAKIFGDEMKIGKLTFNLNADGVYYIGKNRFATNASGRIKSFEYNNYTFKDFQIDGIFNSDKAVANVSFNDENGNGTLYADFFFDGTATDKLATLKLRSDTMKLGNMGLTPEYPDLTISADIDARAEFTSIDDISGYVLIDSVGIGNMGVNYVIDSLDINIFKHNDVQHITVRSPLVEANIDGEYKFSTLFNNLQYQVARELTNLKPIETKKMESSNRLDFNVKIAPLSDIAYMFNSKNSIEDTTYVIGSFSDYDDYFDLNLSTNDIILDKNSIDSVKVFVNSHGGRLSTEVSGIYQTFLDTTYLKANVGVENNVADLDFGFMNTVEKDFSGNIKLSTEFFKPQHSDAMLEVLCTLHESEIIMGDSLWTINKGTIFYDEHKLLVKDIAFESTDQYLRLKGGMNRDIKGSFIDVDLKGVDLSYISEVAYMPDIKLLGIATGKVVIGGALNKDPIINADVMVKQFGLNRHPIADVWAKANFNKETKRIELAGTVVNSTQDTSYVTGYVAPLEESMHLDCRINELPLGFIEPYLVTFSHEMDGIANGNLSVGGRFDAIEIWGDAYVHDAKLGIDYLGSTFHFSDSVHIKRDRFIFKNIDIYDDQGNHGVIDGLVTHHLFQKFKFQIGFKIDNTRVLNTTAADFPDFYGTVFASGAAMIEGDESKVDIHVNAKPEANSYFAVPLDSYRTATDNQFITFVKRDTIRRDATALERRRKRFAEVAPNSILNVDLTIEATPNVEAQIILDSHSGDVIRARGSGNVKVTVDQNADVKLYGKYDITEGEYNFSLQGTIRKKFEVGENSSISFDGDPMNGILNITAKYQTTASLSDLLEESMLQDIKSNSVKVNCIARITGNLQEPQIKFDIELPGADDEVVRRVKATVNTDDMMVQQMVFLLVFGKFYNPQLASTNTGSIATSFATSTISSQLNYWMSQISKDVNFGVNYNDANKDATNNYSVAVNVSTNLFNNRLIINSNVGYRRQYGQENFIGDFDVEYKLTPSGRFRLKAYNKTNDMLYSTALYTQGLGVMYKETFDTWENLGKTYKELTRKKTPEEKAAAKEKKEKEKAQKAKIRAAKKALREDRRRRHKEYVANQKAEKARQKEEKQRLKEEQKLQLPSIHLN